LLLWWSLVAAAAGDLRVEQRALPACLSAERVLARVRTAAPEASGRVVLEAGPGHVTVVLSHEEGVVASRTVALSPENCAEAEKTVGLLLVAWLKASEVKAEPKPASEAVPSAPKSSAPKSSPAVTVAPAPSAPSASSEEVTVAAPPSEEEDEGKDDSVDPTASSGPVTVLARPGETVVAAADEPVVAEAPPTDAAPAPPGFAVALALRAQAAFDGHFVGAGAVSVDAGLSRGIGGLVDVGIETPRTVTSMAGTVSSWLAWASVSARWTLALGPLFLTPALGARLEHLTASASGFTTHHSAELYLAGAMAQVEVRWPIWRGLSLLANLSGVYRFGETDVVVVGLGTVDRVGTAAVSLGIGAAWTL
jgi:hypothetical protein